ncbi:MAG: hypothetical protein LQ342_005840 [Letrouitia transgressa]|nr:MAG: hypothetical protein LQ342_005840 [Letrouitia transgressa]
MATQGSAKTLFLTVDNTRFAYRLIGTAKSTSPPLLMLNHVRSTIDTWDPSVIDPLAVTRQLIIVDYPGLGHSTGAVGASVLSFAESILAFLRVILPTIHATNVDVLGFSLGGYVAQDLALIAPDLINKLVLSGTGPSLGTNLERPMTEIQSTIFSPIPDPAAVITAFFPPTTGSEGSDWLNRSTTSRAGVAGENEEPSIAGFTTGPALQPLIKAYLTWDADPLPYSLLQTIQKDVLVTAGDNDLIVTTQNSFTLARQLPRANFVMFPGSGHGHLFQYAAYFTKLVEDFLGEGLPVAPFSAGTIAPL